jgi:hypothetical protein
MKILSLIHLPTAALVVAASVIILGYSCLILLSCKSWRRQALDEARSLADAVRRHLPSWREDASHLVRDVRQGEYSWQEIGVPPEEVQVFIDAAN